MDRKGLAEPGHLLSADQEGEEHRCPETPVAEPCLCIWREPSRGGEKAVVGERPCQQMGLEKLGLLSLVPYRYEQMVLLG